MAVLEKSAKQINQGNDAHEFACSLLSKQQVLTLP